LRSLADRRVPDELTNLLRVFGRDLRDELEEEPVDELARLPRESGAPAPRPTVAMPRVQKSSSSSKPFSALDMKKRTPARETLLELCELLVAVDIDCARTRP